MKNWPFDAPLYPLLTSTGGPVDQTAAFAPEVGPPITRRRTTARIEAWNMSVMLTSYEQLAAFDSWFEADLMAGALPFAWRHPTTQAVARYQFAPATYSKSFAGAGLSQVSFAALILPGALWFAKFVPDNTARVPDWVADYQADRYWIGQTEIAAGGLSGISGSYTVYEESTTGLRRFFQATYTGDVPTAAPTGVRWLAGFLNAA